MHLLISSLFCPLVDTHCTAAAAACFCWQVSLMLETLPKSRPELALTGLGEKPLLMWLRLLFFAQPHSFVCSALVFWSHWSVIECLGLTFIERSCNP